MATNYSGLKLTAQIEDANLYLACSWYKDSTFLGTTFNRGVVPCNNRNETLIEFTCKETNNIVTATVTFVSSVGENDGDLYQILCFYPNFFDVVIAQRSIEVSGINN